MSIVSLVTHASIVVKIVLVILLLFSLLSWIIIFQRSISLRRATQSFRRFEHSFWSGIDLHQLEENIADQKEGVAHVFHAGFKAFKRLRSRMLPADTRPTPKEASAVLVDVERAMNVAQAVEGARLTRFLPILATISSVSPYIGLFGTVWGIMASFLSLSDGAHATLATVAPWVAEALIATAMGLVAAIPAVIAYNRFSSTTEHLIIQYHDFTEEFHTLLYRNLLTQGVPKHTHEDEPTMASITPGNMG